MAAIASLLAHIVIARQAAGLSSEVLAHARTIAIRQFVEAGWPTQAMQREGALQETTTTLSQRAAMLMSASAAGASQVVTLCMFVLAALVVDPATTVIVVSAGGLIYACMRPIARSTRRRSRAFVNANSRYAEDVSRLTAASMELRVFGVQGEAERMLAVTNESVRHKQFRSRFMTVFGSNLYKDLVVLLLVLCVGGLAVSGVDSIGGIGVVITLIVRSLGSAQQVNNSYQTVIENLPFVEALNRRLAVLSRGAAPVGTARLSRISTIELRGVHYEYTSDVPALTDVTFTLAHGDALGVVGPSGGGKSTLVQVLLRLRRPTSGQVLVNGDDYAFIDDPDWAHAIGFVPQEPILLEGTVAENIAYYRSIPRSDIEQAAREANVFDDIARLPDGFDTKLGPRGSGLSGGQKQRVAIARAIVGRPQLLVMDEPSSALDIRSEQLLQDAIRRLKGDTTIVVIAHRLKTVESCDRLLVLEHGLVAQLGSREELLRSNGFYRTVLQAMQS